MVVGRIHLKHVGVEVIKVNQISTAAESAKLGEIDMAGYVVSRRGSANELDVEQYKNLKVLLSCEHAIYPSSGVEDIGFCRELLEELKPSYLEFTVVDPEKIESSRAQLNALAALDVRKIANGLFLLKDDISLLDRTAHMDALVQSGVEMFQVEIESLVDPESKISSKGRGRIAEFFLRYPTLIGDSFVVSTKIPDVQQRGFYLNLSPAGGQSYDFSQQQYSLSSAMRIIKGLRKV